MGVGLEHFLILSAVLFAIGLYGALAKKNAVVILMCIEIMLNAVNISMVAFAHYMDVIAGQEVAVGLALIIAIFRRKKTLDAEKFDLLKW